MIKIAKSIDCEIKTKSFVNCCITIPIHIILLASSAAQTYMIVKQNHLPMYTTSFSTAAALKSNNIRSKLVRWCSCIHRILLPLFIATMNMGHSLVFSIFVVSTC